jgi:hypothetical protein
MPISPERPSGPPQTRRRSGRRSARQTSSINAADPELAQTGAAVLGDEVEESAVLDEIDNDDEDNDPDYDGE